MSVGFSVSVDTTAARSCCRRASSIENRRAPARSLSVSAARTRPRTSTVSTTNTTSRITASVLKVTASVRTISRGGPLRMARYGCFGTGSTKSAATERPAPTDTSIVVSPSRSCHAVTSR